MVGEARPIESRDWRYVLREHADVAAVVTITWIAAAARFSTLGVQSFDHDEAVTAVRVLQPTLRGTLHVVSHLERSPPLYYTLVWIWAKPLGVGTGPVDLRALSALFGTLTVPLAYLAGRTLASTRAGLIAAGLVAVNPYLIWYSQEARSYELMVLLSTLALYLFARALRRPTPGSLALWALAAALSLTSHYFAVFLVLPEAAWLLASTRPRHWAAWAVAGVGAAGLALLPLAISQEGSGRVNHFTGTPVFKRGSRSLLDLMGSPTGLSPAVKIAAAVILVAMAAAALLLLLRYATRAEKRGAWIALSVALAAFIVPTLLAYGGADYVDPRNMIGVLVPLCVAAGIAFGTARSGGLGLTIAGVLAALFAAVVVRVNLDPGLQRIDWRGAANAIGPERASRAVVMPRLGVVPIQYYLGGRPFHSKAPPTPIRILDTLSTHRGSPPPGHGFQHVSTRNVANDEYRLSVFRARRPVRVTAKELQALNLIGEPARSLLTGAPRKR